VVGLFCVDEVFREVDKFLVRFFDEIHELASKRFLACINIVFAGAIRLISVSST